MASISTAVVITSIAPPNDVMFSIAAGCRKYGYEFYVIGDVSSPSNFSLENCRFVDIAQQLQTGFRTAELLPQRHYARKNIGYLLAARDGSQILIETDDDNYPLETFWAPRHRHQSARQVNKTGWSNVYSYFSEVNIWPRGLPLDAVQEEQMPWEALTETNGDCPIQQGLADENPDVDAIYRLLFRLPVQFRSERRVILNRETWCPFNSQNTTWWRDAFALLYLPSYCSFRMTDIWRSFIAQRVGWECGWKLLFHEPTVYQLRNEHNLMRDFEDEIPGYLQNRKIVDLLQNLPLSSGVQNIEKNLYQCYERLVMANIFQARELELVEAWIDDLKNALPTAGATETAASASII